MSRKMGLDSKTGEDKTTHMISEPQKLKEGQAVVLPNGKTAGVSRGDAVRQGESGTWWVRVLLDSGDLDWFAADDLLTDQA